MNLAQVLSVSLSLWLGTRAGCPPYVTTRPCICTKDDLLTTLECQHRTLKPIEMALKNIRQYQTKIDHLILKSDDMEVINDELLADIFPWAITIKAEKLQRMNGGSFKSQIDVLKTLVISKSNLKDFPLQAICPLRQLKVLQLSYSNLEDIPPLANLTSARSLEQIRLDNNYIRTIREDSFADLTSLRLLDLAHNNIEAIDPGSLSFPSGSCSSITHLYIQNNKLEDIPDELAAVSGGAFINLEFNRISLIDDHKLLELIRKNMLVELEGNPINCNCDAAILMLVKTKITGSCKLPSKLNNRNFEELSDADFKNC